MRVLPRRELAPWLRHLGIDRETMTWEEDEASTHRLLMREADEEAVSHGPHRRLALPDEGRVLKMRVGDRPALGRLVVELMQRTGTDLVCALLPPGSYWLNNRGYAAYLARIPDAQRVHRFLRRVGLTDRFRGGFLIRPHEYASHLPLLTAQAFCGGPDVYFVARDVPLIVMACREFDIHLETREAHLLQQARALAESQGLSLHGLDILSAEDTEEHR